jgi:trimethylamine---corrinoid protein Co-methyltransferase
MIDRFPSKQAGPAGRRGGGREARRRERARRRRRFPPWCADSGLRHPAREAIELIHEESCRILEDVGIEFRDDEAAAMWTASGADVEGYRVRIDRAQLMELVA